MLQHALCSINLARDSIDMPVLGPADPRQAPRRRLTGAGAGCWATGPGSRTIEVRGRGGARARAAASA